VHEFAIAHAILETAVECARQRGAKRILQVTCRVGRMRQVVPDMLQLAFEAQAQGTLAAGAVLVLETVPLRFSCQECGRSFETDEWRECPQCGSPRLTLCGGDELVVRSLEIDVDEPAGSSGSQASAGTNQETPP